MDQALVPAATLVIAVGTAIYTEWQSRQAKARDQKIDERAATKDTVDMLGSLNEALGRQIEEVERRMERLEIQFADCLKERDSLIVERDNLLVKLKGQP